MTFRNIHGFESLDQFNSFSDEISRKVLTGELTQIQVEEKYASEMLPERWFREADGSVWRLVSPEFPFKGLFERVR